MRAGIEAELMQTTSGGLSYWPGGKDPYLWSDLLRFGFLMEAKKAGLKWMRLFWRG